VAGHPCWPHGVASHHILRHGGGRSWGWLQPPLGAKNNRDEVQILPPLGVNGNFNSNIILRRIQEGLVRLVS
jgi:hypothetical protein